MNDRSYSTRIRSDKGTLWKSGRPLLSWLDIELTERCNSDCIHCSINRPAGDEEARAKELTSGEIKDILTEAAGLGCLTVRLTGGEPLLREDFEEIYVSARRLGIRVMIFTNATLITPRLAGLFSRIPPLERMEVSVYGMKKESYEAVSRTSDSFKAARRGIDLLVENGIPFVLKSARLPANKHETRDFESWARALPGTGQRPSYAMFFELRTRRDTDKNRLIRGLRVDPEEAVLLSVLAGEDCKAERRNFAARYAGPQGDRLFTCQSSGGRASVDAYGYFQHCLLLRHPDTVFDLKDRSLREAMTEFMPKIRAFRARNADYLDRCARCFIKALCLQCPARSWSEHGTLDTPVEYLCDVAHAEARSLGLLDEGEKAWTIDGWEERVGKRTGPQNPAGEVKAGFRDRI